MSVSGIVSFGFGAWGGAELLPTLGFGVGEAVAPWTPTLHYHTLEGPSKQVKSLEGPDKTIRVLQGPSKQVNVLAGSK